MLTLLLISIDKLLKVQPDHKTAEWEEWAQKMKKVHQDLASGLRGKHPDPDWDSYPLARDHFLQAYP